MTDNVILFQRAIDFSWTKSATDLSQGSSSAIYLIFDRNKNEAVRERSTMDCTVV